MVKEKPIIAIRLVRKSPIKTTYFKFLYGGLIPWLQG